MRKLLLTLAVLCGTVSAWAQTVVTAINTEKVYTLECMSGAVHSTTRFIADDGTTINGQSGTSTFFCFEDGETEGTYYIKSVVSSKYLNCDAGNLSASTTKSTAWVLGTVGETVTFKVPETTTYLNNNGTACTDGTVTNLKANNHASGPNSGNACSTWQLCEYSADGIINIDVNASTNLYWTPDTWEDPSNTPNDVTAVEATQYPSKASNVKMSNTKINVKAGVLKATLVYSDGNNRLDIVGVDLLDEEDNIVASDYHFAYTGNAHQNNTYTLLLTTEGTYTIRYWVTFCNEANSSSGTITLVHNESSLTDQAKEAAKAELDLMATVPVIYPNATSAKNEIDAVTPENNTLEAHNAAIETINTIVSNYRTSAYQALAGKMFSIKTPERTNNGYMEMSTSSVTGVASATSPADIWQFVYNDGTVKVYNPYMDKYLAEPGGNSAKIGTTDAANAGSYHLNVTGNPANEVAKVKLTSNGKSIHMDGSINLVRWDNGGASEWMIEEITDFSSIIDDYKTSAVATLDEWAQLSVVFDAETIKTAKTNLDAITTTDWATFANIDAELKKVFDEVETKKFTFQTKATDANRAGVWVSANVSASKAIGADNADLNAIWGLRHAAGSSFYMYNLANNKYMGTPGGQCVLADAKSASYTFEIINAANGVVELKSEGGTLHASNWGDDALISWDGDEDASRWTIASVSITDEQIAALVALNSAYNAKGFGNEIGLYSMTEEIIAAVELLAKAPKDLETVTVDDINAKKDAVVAHTAINAPAIGKFYRLKNVTSSNYMSSTDTDAVVMLTDGAEAVSTIFYLDEENKLLSYNKGLFLDCGNKKTAAVGTSYAGEFAVAYGGATAGVVTYKNNGYWTFGNRANGENIDRGQNTPNQAGYNWTLEEVEWLPVPVNTEVGYATIYSPVELELSYGRFKAYTATINEAGTAITLTDQSVVPANTGVVLEYQEGATIENGYVFLQIKETTLTDVKSELRGTFADSYVADDAYILAKPEGYAAGFYKAKKNYEDGTKFLNNGFKAYLPKPASSEARFYVFDFGTETGIEGIESENAKAEIYDLSGRRVQNAQKGLYIVNGKKVIK